MGRTFAYVLIALGLFLFSWLPVTFAETPREFANRFYQAHRNWNIRGYPDAREIQKVSGYFGSESLRLFKAVENQRQRGRLRFKRQYEGDPNPPLVKPAWSKEGDCLSSVYEGISAFAVGRQVLRHGRIVVPAHLKYDSFSWTDHLVLDRAGKEWVVADIRYKDGRSLVSSLTSELVEMETYLRSPIR